jgi:uncharacterized membrane protein YiaA
MHYLVDTEQMQAEGLLSAQQIATIKDRSRTAMVALGVNTVLAGGILAAAGGFIFWLADTLLVAITGGVFLLIGVMILLRAGPLYRMLGNASALIGAGMLLGGATLKLIENLAPMQAAQILLVVGAVAALLGLWLYRRLADRAGFLLGSVVLMAMAMHLVGLYLGLQQFAGGQWHAPIANLYATLVLLGIGYLLDLRVVTALAILPFAQMLDTSTAYFHATYAFYSPEPTLSILQMSVAMVIGLWLLQHRSERVGRHGGIFAMMAFVVGNLCFLVGSLFGDVVGSSFIHYPDWNADIDYDTQMQAYDAATAAWRAKTVEIGEHVYAVVWALALAAMVFYAAHRNRRGLFNAALTFGAIHAYTQLFENFADEPLAYVIGGLAAVPLAWGIWRMNDLFRARQAGAV